MLRLPIMGPNVEDLCVYGCRPAGMFSPEQWQKLVMQLALSGIAPQLQALGNFQPPIAPSQGLFPIPSGAAPSPTTSNLSTEQVSLRFVSLYILLT